jgi:Domain of unknown function (DUF4424)
VSLRCGSAAVRLGLGIVFAAIIAAPAQSNTRTTELASGGLHFPYHPSIKLDRQEVRIGIDAVRLSYTLSSKADTDETLLVAFPLPDLDMSSLVWTALRLPIDNDSNFVGLSVTAGARTIDPELHQRARAMGIDVTQHLFQSNLPLFPFASGLVNQLTSLAPDRQARFARSGIAARIENRWQPLWTLSSTLHWWQPVPKSAPTTISAAYKPVSGSAQFSSDDLARLKESHCIGARETDAIAKRATTNRPVSEITTITYSIAAGANQLGPAGSVRVVIELPDDTTIAATCQDGFRRTGPLTLEFALNNASLEDDIHIAFLK